MIVLCTTSSFDAPTPAHWTVVGNPHERRLTESEVLSLVQSTAPDGIIAGTEPLTRSVLRAAPHLRAVSRCGVGLDNVDVRAAEDLGIAVRNTPEAPVTSVAELTVGLIFAGLRHIPETDAAVRSGAWPKARGGLLAGKTVGIIGCGRIGTAVARMLAPFGCTVYGSDPVVKTHDACRMVGLRRLLSESDVVSLHAPLNEHTRHLINAETLSAMKPTALLVNTARGALIEETALVAALRSDRLSCAALDVFEEEPYTGPLTELSHKTILTSHVGSGAAEARAVMEMEAVRNLAEVLDGHRPE